MFSQTCCLIGSQFSIVPLYTLSAMTNPPMTSPLMTNPPMTNPPISSPSIHIQDLLNHLFKGKVVLLTTFHELQTRWRDMVVALPQPVGAMMQRMKTKEIWNVNRFEVTESFSREEKQE